MERYQRALAEVTPATALEAARRRIRPDHMTVIVVGKESEFERPLAGEGLPVQRLDIRIPPPSPRP